MNAAASSGAQVDREIAFDAVQATFNGAVCLLQGLHNLKSRDIKAEAVGVISDMLAPVRDSLIAGTLAKQEGVE